MVRRDAVAHMDHDEQENDTTGLLGGDVSSSRDFSLASSLASSTEGDSGKHKKKKKKKSKDEKKSKKHKKEKKSKKSKKNKKATNDNTQQPESAEDDHLASITEKEAALVEELCSFLSDTLATSENQKCFLNMLKEDHERVSSARELSSAQQQSPIEKTPDTGSTTMPPSGTAMPVGYGMLPSVCSVDFDLDDGGDDDDDEDDNDNESAIIPEPLGQLFSICSLQEEANSKTWGSVAPPSVAGSRKTAKSETTATTTATDLTSKTAEKTPEKLFSALPTEFKAYLMQVTLESMGQSQGLDEPAPPVGEIVADRDDYTVASDITGVTGLYSNALPSPPSSNRIMQQKPVLRSFQQDSGSESSDSDTDDEESNGKNSNGLDSDSRRSNQSIESNEHCQQNSYILDTIPIPPSAYCVPPAKPCFKKRLRKPTPRKPIQFCFDSSVSIREYETILADNPACTEGPSIGIGWKYYIADRPTSLEYMDSLPKRHKSELILSSRDRKSMLLNLGYSSQEIAASIRSANKTRHQRKTTVQNLGAQNLEYAMEKMGRSFKKVLMMQSASTPRPAAPRRRASLDLTPKILMRRNSLENTRSGTWR